MGDQNGDVGAVGKESINTEIVTLTSFLNEEQTKHKEATGDFTYVQAPQPLIFNRLLIDTLPDYSAMHCSSPSSQ